MQSPSQDRSAELRPLKWYRSLATRKGRLDAGAFLVEGERAIRQILDGSPGQILEIVSTAEPGFPLQGHPSRMVSERQMESICSTRTPQGVLAVVRLPMETYSDELPDDIGDRILLLEDVQDPGNVGTLIRTAAAFGFSGVVLTLNCADPMAPKCVQSSAGAVLSLWLRRTAQYLDLVTDLKGRGYRIVAADLDGVEDSSVLRTSEGLLLALGNEGGGLSDALLAMASHRLRIATERRRAESLNVAACGAICMYLSREGGETTWTQSTLERPT
jgi:TrmH family RNA methyltransferase